MELISSDETASKISDICIKNGVKNEEAIEGVAYHIISVLLGKLPQEILSKALVTNLKIDSLTAKRISEEANRLIFSQRLSPEAEKPTTAPAPLPEEEKTTLPIEEPVKEVAQKPRGKDVYHEPIV